MARVCGMDAASAPPGIRIWGGSTVENKNVELVLPWIDWAYLTTKEAFKK